MCNFQGFFLLPEEYIAAIIDGIIQPISFPHSSVMKIIGMLIFRTENCLEDNRKLWSTERSTISSNKSTSNYGRIGKLEKGIETVINKWLYIPSRKSQLEIAFLNENFTWEIVLYQSSLTFITMTKYPHVFSYVILFKWHNKYCHMALLCTNRKVQSFVLCMTAFTHYRTMKYLQREG